MKRRIGGGGGGQNGIEDPINYGTFSTQKYEVRQVYQHRKGGILAFL